MAVRSHGDEVVCLIKDGIIVDANHPKWDSKQVFEIIKLYAEGYLIYVPSTLYLKDSVLIEQNDLTRFELDTKFIGSYIYYITDYMISYLHKKLDGMVCAKCLQFYHMARPNQSDDKTLICWNCRHYYSYR